MERIKVILSLIGGWFIFLIGGLDSFFTLLVALIVMDIVTGLINAGIEGKINPDVMLIGAYKKILIFLLIIISNLLQLVFTDFSLREPVIMYFLIQEGLSILQNIENYINVPPIIKQFFKNREEEEIEKN